jgi:hypothetical protein
VFQLSLRNLYVAGRSTGSFVGSCVGVLVCTKDFDGETETLGVCEGSSVGDTEEPRDGKEDVATIMMYWHALLSG